MSRMILCQHVLRRRDAGYFRRYLPMPELYQYASGGTSPMETMGTDGSDWIAAKGSWDDESKNRWRGKEKLVVLGKQNVVENHPLADAPRFRKAQRHMKQKVSMSGGQLLVGKSARH